MVVFPDVPRIAQTSLALSYILWTLISKFITDWYLKMRAQELGVPVDQVLRSQCHALGLVSRIFLLYIIIILCEAYFKGCVLDTASFIALIAFDSVVLAYSSLF